jgi:hypothetical protein
MTLSSSDLPETTTTTTKNGTSCSTGSNHEDQEIKRRSLWLPDLPETPSSTTTSLSSSSSPSYLTHSSSMTSTSTWLLPTTATTTTTTRNNPPGANTLDAELANVPSTTLSPSFSSSSLTTTTTRLVLPYPLMNRRRSSVRPLLPSSRDVALSFLDATSTSCTHVHHPRRGGGTRGGMVSGTVGTKNTLRLVNVLLWMAVMSLYYSWYYYWSPPSSSLSLFLVPPLNNPTNPTSTTTSWLRMEPPLSNIAKTPSHLLHTSALLSSRTLQQHVEQQQQQDQQPYAPPSLAVAVVPASTSLLLAPRSNTTTTTTTTTTATTTTGHDHQEERPEIVHIIHTRYETISGSLVLLEP